MSSPIIKFRVRFLNDATFTEFALLQALNSISALDVMTVQILDSHAILQIKDPNQLSPFLVSANVLKLTAANLAIEEEASSKSLRSIYVPRVPLWVASAPLDYLTSLINEANDNVTVTDLYFLGSATKTEAPKHNLKVTFETVGMRDFALAQGLKIGHYNISAAQILPDSFIEVQQCYRCLQFGHTVKTCSSSTQICSKCAGDHSHKICSSTITKCFNCGEQHKAIFAACSKRKLYVHNLRSQSQQQSPSFQPAPPPTNNPWHRPTPSNMAPASNSYPPLPTSDTPPPPASSSLPTHPPASSSLPTHPPASSSLPPQPPPPSSLPSSHILPPPTPLQSSPSSSSSDALNLQYQTFDTFAKMAAGSNSVKYLKLMNEFFGQQGMTPIAITQNILNIVNDNSPSAPLDSNNHSSQPESHSQSDEKVAGARPRTPLPSRSLQLTFESDSSPLSTQSRSLSVPDMQASSQVSDIVDILPDDDNVSIHGSSSHASQLDENNSQPSQPNSLPNSVTSSPPNASSSRSLALSPSSSENSEPETSQPLFPVPGQIPASQRRSGRTKSSLATKSQSLKNLRSK